MLNKKNAVKALAKVGIKANSKQTIGFMMELAKKGGYGLMFNKAGDCKLEPIVK